MNLRKQHAQLTQIFANAHISSPEVEAKLLLCHLLSLDYSNFMLHQDLQMTETDLEKLENCVTERLTGRPIQYIIGHTEFYGIELAVNESVLIPRPETEVLVYTILNRIKPNSGNILDLCTGSGAIALALQNELNYPCEIVAVDLSPQAIKQCRLNIDRYKQKFPERPITLLQGDLFAPIGNQKFSIIVSNPPYVTEEEYLQLPTNVKEFEPKMALTAPDCGLEILKRIAKEGPSYLETDGVIMCEMGDWQGEEVEKTFRQYFTHVEIIKDYTGRNRFVLAYGKIS
jgi:release factor glutamine methyltransferase